MTKEYFTALAKYSNWTDNIMMDWLSQRNEAQWEQQITSSFNSIRDTVVHMVSAKKIWLDFWTNRPAPAYLSTYFNGSKDELLEIWKNASCDLENFVNEYPEESYDQMIAVTYPDGRQAKMEFWKTLPHFVNHATYHRGQVVTMLREAGFAEFKNTDLFTYFILNT